MHLVDRHSSPPRFATVWHDAGGGQWYLRRGTIGRASPATVIAGAADSATEQTLIEPYLSEGFRPFPDEDRADVVIQWPMRSLTGNARDWWLLQRATDFLDAYLDERGLGYVDGHDSGRRLSSHGGFVQNLFCYVVDGNLGAQAAMSALRAGRIDATRATIAYSLAGSDDWTVRYERRSAKMPGPFTL